VVVVVGDAGAELLADGGAVGGGDEREVAPLQRIRLGDVADQDVRDPGVVQVGERRAIPLNESRPITLDFGVVAWPQQP